MSVNIYIRCILNKKIEGIKIGIVSEKNRENKRFSKHKSRDSTVVYKRFWYIRKGLENDCYLLEGMLSRSIGTLKKCLLSEYENYLY